MCKDTWNVDCGVWRVEHKFNCGITGLRKAERMSMTMLVLVARARQQPMETLKQWKIWYWIVDEALLGIADVGISFGSCQAIFKDVLGIKRGATKIVPIWKFWAKTASHGHRPGDVDDDPDLIKKIITGDKS